LRPKQAMTKSRRDRMAGALKIGIPASAVALAGAGLDMLAATAFADATIPIADATTQSEGLHVHLKSRRIAYDHNVTVSGVAPASDAGERVVLEFIPSGGTTWRPIAVGHVRRRGRFRLVAPLQRSGLVKVVGATRTPTSPVAVAAGGPPSSVPQTVAVAAGLRVREREVNALGRGSVDVRGTVLPRVAGRVVRLQVLSGGGWRTVARGRTGARGGFVVRYATGRLGAHVLRVRFGGDGQNGWSSAGAGRLTVYRQTVASWYDDGGTTACGFHAYYGVASPSLPCGTSVRLYYGGRTVDAVVDDRGPFVGGRDWDLNQNTAAALGFAGVDTVWSSV
jgi:rare lipoprotein A